MNHVTTKISRSTRDLTHRPKSCKNLRKNVDLQWLIEASDRANLVYPKAVRQPKCDLGCLTQVELPDGV